LNYKTPEEIYEAMKKASWNMRGALMTKIRGAIKDANMTVVKVKNFRSILFIALCSPLFNLSWGLGESGFLYKF